MIFKLKKAKDKFLEAAYNKVMSELNAFYGIGWVRNCPNIFIVENRKDIDELEKFKTGLWQVGWVSGWDVFILDKSKVGKESERAYSKEEYEALLKHELSHLFFGIMSGTIGMKPFPVWFCEGVAIYTADIQFKKPVKEFKSFLKFYEEHGHEVYEEAGFFIEILVKKFGKVKLLELIKSLKIIKTQKDFDKTFNKIYGFKLNYKEINKLHNAK